MGNRRRGLIAGAAALVAGVLAKQAAEPVAAGADGDVIAGGSVTVGTTTTVILNSHIQTGAAFIADNGFNSGAFDIKGDGIQGYTTNPVTKVSNAGVFGCNNDLNGVGTWGEAPSGTGVFGQSTTGVGVFAFSTSSYGVLGASNQSHGVTGTSQAAGFAGLVGVASYDNTTGLVGVANSGTNNTFAARFTGPVLVNGALIVGSGGKSAAAKHKDGTHRLLYCVEAPDSWFEDFGEGALVNGKAEVKLDPEFAGVVDASAMHVFITEHDQHNALHVAK